MARTTENPLDSIVPIGTGGTVGEPLNVILNQLFWGGLVIAVVLAVVMVIVGAIQYMTTDAFSGKEEGKGKIKAALGGLVLAFSTIILLNTINPNLTSFELRFMPLNLQRTQTGVSGGGTIPVAQPGITAGTRGIGENAIVRGNFSNVTVADLRPHMGPGYTDAHLQAFINAGRQYNIDPRFLASISKFETANGTSRAFTDGRNNAMGTSNSTGPIGFNSVEESIFTQTRSLARESGPYAGTNTIKEIGLVYSPPVNPATGRPYQNDINSTNWLWVKQVTTNYERMTGGQ